MATSPEAEGSIGTSRSEATRRRTGRRPGDSGSRQMILQAARKVFAQHGYGAATMRAIAREAGVDTALIHHYFATKSGLFATAIQDGYPAAEVIQRTVLPGPLDDLGARFIRGYLALWNNPDTRDPMLAVIRSAITNDEAAGIMAGFIADNVVRPVVRELDTTEPELRATLVGTQLVGLAVARYLLKVEPLASLDEETLIRICAPLIQRCLTGSLDSPAELGGEPVGRLRSVWPAAPQTLFQEPQ
ncbi:TetR family transcriptional regulator [Streptomyces sp. NPDC050704]|uniref:TetR/AcrR family transcriptional regulator n=1 Tax=Streptomyces sp. NPDC050704 TaxID=3157219 RepID=UPI003413159D